MQIVQVIDCDINNTWSLVSAFNYIGANTNLTRDPEVIKKAPVLVLPGVGSFQSAMQKISSLGIDDAIREAVLINNRTILGICLGMQLLGSESTEDGGAVGLGIIPNKVDYLKVDADSSNKLRLPHIGFNNVDTTSSLHMFTDVLVNPDFYFLHSLRMLPDNLSSPCATCTYGETFLASFEKENIWGTQFHPEKSQSNGLQLLRNFLRFV